MKAYEVVGNETGRTYPNDYTLKYEQITSLEGCPMKVNGNFTVKLPNLKSLEFSPSVVMEAYSLLGVKKLKDLEGISEVIYGNAVFIDCGLDSLKGLKDVRKDVVISNCKFTSTTEILKQVVKYGIKIGGTIVTDFGGTIDPKEDVKKLRMGKFKDFLDL